MVGRVDQSAAAGKADHVAPSQEPTGSLDGAALFQQHCAVCHGADATGGASYPGSIVGYEPIEPIVTTGDGAMPPVPIAPDEISAIQRFLLGDTPDVQPDTGPVDENTSPALQTYAENCATCHGPEGAGTPSGPQIRFRDPGLAEFTVRQGRNGPGNPTVMPVYGGDEIPDEQLDEIVAWLDSFPNPTDGEGLYNRYCANCHGADGLGGPSFKPLVGRVRAGSIVREGHGNGQYADRREYMPGWTQDELSDEEILLIEEYMRTL